jgi:hypothetical protein
VGSEDHGHILSELRADWQQPVPREIDGLACVRGRVGVSACHPDVVKHQRGEVIRER